MAESQRLQHIRTGIAALEDAVAEAHDAAVAFQRLANPSLRTLGASDLAEHFQNLGGCAAMQRPLQGSDSRRSRGDQIGPGRCDYPGSEGRRVGAQLLGQHQIGLKHLPLTV
ncbi:hypothetical protein D3C71_1809550 [compost metagenome]